MSFCDFHIFNLDNWRLHRYALQLSRWLKMNSIDSMGWKLHIDGFNHHLINETILWIFIRSSFRAPSRCKGQFLHAAPFSQGCSDTHFRVCAACMPLKLESSRKTIYSPISLTYSWCTFFKSIRSDRSFEVLEKCDFFHTLRLKLYQVQQRKKWNIAKKMSWSSTSYVERRCEWFSSSSPPKSCNHYRRRRQRRNSLWRLEASSQESVYMRRICRALRTFPFVKIYTENRPHGAFYPWNIRRIMPQTSIIPHSQGTARKSYCSNRIEETLSKLVSFWVFLQIKIQIWD